MDDRLRETLSAMMDDEADELAVHRVLSQCRDPHVRAQWQRWHQLRSLMHEQRHHRGQPDQGVTVDVSAAVRAVIDDPADPSSHPSRSQPETVTRRRSPVRGWSAVAAVSLALLVGFGAGSQWQPTNDSQAEPGALVASPGPQKSEAEEHSLSHVAIQQLDPEQRDQVSRYLLEHAQHGSVGISNGSVGYARVASASAGVR